MFFFVHLRLRQAARHLLLPLPGDETIATISDAFNVAIQRLRAKLDDFVLVAPGGYAGLNVPAQAYAVSSQGGASARQNRQGAQQLARPVKPVQPRLLGGMGSGAPQCTISVHDPAKGGDMVKWCSYDHTSYGQAQPSAANILAATTLAQQGGSRAVNGPRAAPRRSHSAPKKKK